MIYKVVALVPWPLPDKHSKTMKLRIRTSVNQENKIPSNQTSKSLSGIGLTISSLGPDVLKELVSTFTSIRYHKSSST